MAKNELDIIPADSRVFIYGAGSAGRSLYMWLAKCREDVRMMGFIDSFKNSRCAGLPVYQADRFARLFSRETYDLILIASGAARDIAAHLEQLGIHCYITVSVPSYLMENLIPPNFSEWFKAFFIRFFSRLFIRRKHIFFGEHGGKFIGNNKYFYLYLREQCQRPVLWAVEDPLLEMELREEGIRVFRFRPRGFRSWITLFTASHFYFDNMTWQRKYLWLRHFKAFIIHMSHGIGLKLTEKMLIPGEFMEKLSPDEQQRLDKKIFNNHLLLSTSPFYAEKVSSPAYNTPLNKIILSGYPKNDLFYTDIPGARIFTDSPLLNMTSQYKREGYQVIVYTPTFRDMDSRFRHSEAIDFPEMEHFLNRNRLILIIKGHASGGSSGNDGRTRYNSIFVYDGGRDGYPLLKEADLLITDYSSIYMDFLHRRKPVLFFIHDYEEYISRHREIQFDYEAMTPGPKARDHEELIQWIHHFLVKHRDGFQDKREKILELAFLFRYGDARRRVLEEMKKRRLYP